MYSCGWEGSSLISFISFPCPLKCCFVLMMELRRWGVGPRLSQELRGATRRALRDEASWATSPFPPGLLKGSCHGESDQDGARRQHVLVDPPPRPRLLTVARGGGKSIPLSACSAGRTDRPPWGLPTGLISSLLDSEEVPRSNESLGLRAAERRN